LKRFIGKVALITGASRGIGQAVARAFAEEGAWVALCSRDRTALTELAEELNQGDGRAIALKCDVTDKIQVAETITKLSNKWGKIEVVVNNAGVSGRTPIDEDCDDRWHEILNTNLTGSYLVTKAALDLMNSGQGRIINISSVLGRFGVPGYAAYCTSKHGIIGFTRAIALELVSRGITVNAISPGWVSTEMADQGIRETADVLGISPDAFREQAIRGVPIRRFIEPEEVAKLVLYLASTDAAAITGQTYNLCGGQTMD
jgi:NAD(P)-dependent dehydrogenase (short-subunit alcohol dehydrogenase family)